MSDDLPANRPPKLRSEASSNTADAQDMLLPGSLKTALLRELSPTRSQRERVQSAIAASIGGPGATSPAIDQAHAEMAARAEQLHAASVAGGTSLATKVIVSSLVLVSVAALGTISLRRSEPHAVKRAPIATPSAVPQVPRAADAPAPRDVAEPPPEPTAAPATKLGVDSRASSSPSIVAESPDSTGHARARRVRAAVSPPSAARVPAASAERSAPESTRSDTANEAKAEPVASAAKPALTLAAQIALVRGASDALDRQDAKAALALLARYRQTYPAGSLAIEVQALRAIALCLDKHPGATEARDAFLREHGKSALAGRVRSGCK